MISVYSCEKCKINTIGKEGKVMQMGKPTFSMHDFRVEVDIYLELISYTCIGQALFAKADFGEATPSLIAGFEADEGELDVGDN